MTSETQPPTVTLLDRDGRAVASQVGTFQWAGVVSSSPLLSGAPVTLSLGQDLEFASPGPPASSWQATLYADPTDPASGRTIGSGDGAILLRPPAAAGIWTVAVQLIYPDGDVFHFWRLTIGR